jgi:D-arabinose 1-dehydrogenase-like Zn-dependent alcohol dehydrogenase
MLGMSPTRMSKINDAFDHLKSGNAKYRIVLSNR